MRRSPGTGAARGAGWWVAASSITRSLKSSQLSSRLMNQARIERLGAGGVPAADGCSRLDH